MKDDTCEILQKKLTELEDRWFHSVGRIVREPDGSGEFFGIHEDIMDQMIEQHEELFTVTKKYT